MDTRQLAAFCTVVERKSFSQAAERLGVTQPAVSLQIRSLEQRLGTQLLDRSGRRVEPTEAGLRLYASAQKLLALEEALTNRKANVSIAITEGHLSLAPHNSNPILTEWLTGVYHARAMNLYQRHGARVKIASRAPPLDIAMASH